MGNNENILGKVNKRWRKKSEIDLENESKASSEKSFDKKGPNRNSVSEKRKKILNTVKDLDKKLNIRYLPK
jgi:hypothetical protein